MNDRDLKDWLDQHGGELSRENVEKSYQDIDPQTSKATGEPKTKIDYTVITAKDGAKIKVRRATGSGGPVYNGPSKPDPGSYQENPENAEARTTYEVVGTEPAKSELPQPGDTRSAEQRQIDTDKAALSAQDRREAEWNQNNAPSEANPSGRGSGYYETHQERAAREQRDAEQRRQQQQAQLAQESGQRAQRQEERQTAADERSATQQAETNRQNQLRIDEEIRHNQVTERGRPAVIGSPSDTSQNIAVFNPDTGEITATPNPAYDAVKAEAQRQKEQLSLDIERGRLTLAEATQKYTQWFDTNVKVPFMQANEARDQAADSRAALQAEDRRREFAATFGLQKAELGQKAGQDAAQNEIALLPYRAGPTEAADMSDAINGLAAGGVVGGPSPSAGIHFQASDFQFDRPDFKKIAAEATKTAIGGLTNYRPAEGSYATANYNGISLPSAATLQGAPAIPAISGTSNYQYPESQGQSRPNAAPTP